MLVPLQPDKGEKIYYRLKDELEKEYGPEYYVVINPKTEKYFVGETSVDAMKKARRTYPKGELLLAQVGRLTGLMK